MSSSEARRRGGCLGVLVFGVVAGAIFASVVGFIFWRVTHPDQSDLSTRVDLVLGPHTETNAGGQVTQDYRVIYTYEVDGHTYRDKVRTIDDDWLPGDALTACVDPSDPARHAVLLGEDAGECGEENLHNRTQRADKVD